MSTKASEEELFAEVCSEDFLNFKFGSRGYQDQLNDSIAKTQQLAGVTVKVVSLPTGDSGAAQRCVWVMHNFGFLGGSLGCAEGEKIARAFEYAREQGLPVCVQCRTGGARMQEGTSSLMQMAKVSVAVEALHKASLPFVSVLSDPTYGGVSASYAMQADVRLAVQGARIGFAGPQVILNTMCEANQEKFDQQCPADFQSAEYVLQYGQLDAVLDAADAADGAALQARLETTVANIFQLLMAPAAASRVGLLGALCAADAGTQPTAEDMATPFNYTNSRAITRPQAQDIIAALFGRSFVELSGDGRVGRDCCIRGGIGRFGGGRGSSSSGGGEEGEEGGITCVVIGTFKGHSPQEMQDANFGMASPHGYRTALRLMRLAERFGLPVLTLVDTVGAWPTFDCERDGQSEAIASNLTAMGGLSVPIITLLVGEGGSGGALGIGMGNAVGMLSGGYFGVISPEGAASILGRYKDDAHKAQQFPRDCQELAVAQCIYADQLQRIGVVDEIIWESAAGETYESFPILTARIRRFISSTLQRLLSLSKDELIQQRYQKYRAMGSYRTVSAPEERAALVQTAQAAAGASLARAAESKKKAAAAAHLESCPSAIVRHLAELTVNGAASRYRGLAPSSCPLDAPAVAPFEDPAAADANVNAKHVLDTQGPEALARWARKQQQVLLTDTTMRDAHQSLLATRVRTEDLVKGAACASKLLSKAFSLEMWGGATFDVSMRFLDECPWRRLQEIRAACPNVCLQMLIRGSNAVGYTSYPDNVVAEFCRLAARNGIDVFRIFDCFNDIDNMTVCINAVKAAGKVAEVCLCYTGNLLTSSIYDVAYYKEVAARAVAAGAHIIGIKDMAGLLRPGEAGPLLRGIREVIPAEMPVHFHTHSTSSGAIATCMEMARHGCDIIDVCTASMADGTSQPSMNALVAMLEGFPERATGLDFLQLEPYDMYWARVRGMYSQFESGMLSGSARVYEHQIPGGQYSNLLVQCRSLGLWDRWEEVLDAYRDANRVLGDIVKVTPSSKCVGDLALYMVNRNLSAEDLLDPAKASTIDFPDSVVGLMRGDLGFPHRGFPSEIEKAVLRGEERRQQRAGLTLPPADLAANAAAVMDRFGDVLRDSPVGAEEQGMSFLLYPKVFEDYINSLRKKGGLALRYLPTPLYQHGLVPGQKASMLLPAAVAVKEILNQPPSNAEAVETISVTIALERVGPLKNSQRELVFTVNGAVQRVRVKDSTMARFVFEGPMADSKNPTHIGSPMPGQIEKMETKAGAIVRAGDTLCTVSAMKMEVKVTAPHDGVVKQLHCEAVGTRVVEGALLMIIEPCQS